MEKQPKEKNKATILQSLCYVNDDMFVLATCGGKYHLIHFNHDKVIAVYPAASGMWLATAFLNPEGKPTVALAAQRGNTQIISPGVKPKKIVIETAGTGPGKLGYLSNAFTYENEAYLSGSNHQLYVYRDGVWQDVRPNLIKAIEENSYAEIRFRSTHDMTLRNGKVLLLANENIFEGDGNTWTKFFGNNHFNDRKYKSIAYLPSEESVYLSADYKSLTKINSKGESTDITIINRGTTEIWYMQPIGDKLYLEMSAPVVGGAKAMLLENDTLVDGSPIGIAQNRRIHNVNGQFYFMGGKTGLFHYENNEWISIPLPEL
ncbi:hypothetical protein [Parabacteroides sp. PF5-9]|uniref:hypothetical protein n=1 Tax=Parabacteroides sp. PF5-9 TaxID=1742404 RepID=UPI0024746AFB|nr:hypothetical protein [Parabacteroides sp. PF5-9]MDH6357294.1 hypothetical protein [Parabacteroides sp. PF5-9]